MRRMMMALTMMFEIEMKTVIPLTNRPTLALACWYSWQNEPDSRMSVITEKSVQ